MGFFIELIGSQSPSMKGSCWTPDFFPDFLFFINIFIITQIRCPELTCQTLLLPVFVLLAGADVV